MRFYKTVRPAMTPHISNKKEEKPLQFKRPTETLISCALKMHLLTGMVECSGCILRPAIQYDYLLIY